jgi:hypothetical protein
MLLNFKYIGLAVILLFSGFASVAQIVFKGKVVDSDGDVPLNGVNITLTQINNSENRTGGITDAKGSFSIPVSAKNTYYRLIIDYIGYTKVIRDVVSTQDINLIGMIRLKQSDIELKTALVEAKTPPVTQKSDTTEFSARSYKVNPDATAEDLVKKMPGITQENGTIKAQGEEVRKVFVDGREFFGDDATTALKNLPAEVVDKIQVFDRMSDQSRFTGFDDGNTMKSLNIVTKAGMSNGYFGKVNAGYGTDERYESGLTLNYFKGKRRISLLSMSNNVNQQNFSSQDLMGAFGSSGQSRWGSGRPPGMGGPSSSTDASSFLTGQRSGISTTNAAGLNYNDMWGTKLNVQANYFFNHTENDFESALKRQFFISDGASQIYDELTEKNSINLNHRVNARFEYNPDTIHGFIFQSKYSFQGSQNATLLQGLNMLASKNISESVTGTDNDGQAYSLNENLMWNYKFKKRGRSLSTQLNYDQSNSVSDGTLNSDNIFQMGSSTLNQINDQLNFSRSGSLNLSYTEPISSVGQLQITYNPVLSRNENTKQTYNFDTLGQTFSVKDSSLSSAFDNQVNTQRLGVNYRIKKDKLTLSLGANYQYVKLDADQTYPILLNVSQPFANILPMGMMMYQFSKSGSIRAFARGYTQTPQLSQLQNVLNNSNPLQLSIGNPNLKQATSYILGSRFNKANMVKSTSFSGFMHGSITRDYIGNATYISTSDTLNAEGVLLPRGSQLSRPVNLNGNGSFRSAFTFAMPIKKIKSNLNLNWGFSYSRTPGLINNVTNLAHNYTLNGGFLMGSNISKDLDFSIGYNTAYIWVINSIQPENNNNYLTGNGTFRFNWMPWKGLVLTTDLSNSIYRGLSSTFNQQIWLWNAGLGYKFLKEKQAEVRLIAFDLLKQNQSINRLVTETYVEDTNTSILQQYFMVSFIYNVRNFAKPTMPPTPGPKKP